MADIKQITIGSTTYDIKDDIARTSLIGKEDKLQIETSSSSTLTAVFGKYYIFTTAADTFSITLPATTASELKNILFWLNTSTGSSQSITWTPDNNENVYELSNYSLDANSTYEVNALWNGTCWCITYTKFTIVS